MTEIVMSEITIQPRAPYDPHWTERSLAPVAVACPQWRKCDCMTFVCRRHR